jgi:rifampicin phosphotransferase
MNDREPVVSLIPLGGDRPIVEDVGMKAWSLHLARAGGLATPAGLVAPGRVLAQLAERAGVTASLTRLLGPGALGGRKQAEGVLYTLVLESDEGRAMIRALRQLGEVLAVRSSFAFEDTALLHHAGMFESVLGVRASDETVVAEALARVWSSAANVCRLRPEAGPPALEALHIVVQEYVDFRHTGVAFSRDPVSGHSGKVLVEAAASVGGVVDGGAEGVQRAAVDRNSGETLHAGALPERILIEAARAAIRFEEHFPDGVDLEWGATASGDVMVVQARGITGNPSVMSVPSGLFVTLDDPAVASLVVSPNVRKIVAWYWDKRRWCNRVARLAGVTHQSCALVHVELARHPGDAAALAEFVGTPYVRVKADREDILGLSSTSIVPTVDLADWLGAACARDLGRDWMFVSSFHEADCSGVAARLASGATLVEFCPGSIATAISGSKLTSSLVLDDAGAIVSSTSNVYNWVEIYDRDAATHRTVDVAPFLPGLPDAARAQLVALCRELDRHFGECRVEWMFCGEELVFYDLSVEHGQLDRHADVSSARALVVSEGLASGPVVRLTEDDLSRLGSTSDLRPSVVPSAAELRERAGDAANSARRALIDGVASAPIVFAPYPDLALVFLIDDVAGFVFERGAMLSHFAIILRQSGLPAVIDPDEFAAARSGTKYRLHARVELHP